MDIRHDSEGFLLGEKIESITDQLGEIHKELKAIKSALGESVVTPPAAEVQPPPGGEATIAPPTITGGGPEVDPSVTVIVDAQEGPDTETLPSPPSPEAAPGGAPALPPAPGQGAPAQPSDPAAPGHPPLPTPPAGPSDSAPGSPPVVVVPGGPGSGGPDAGSLPSPPSPAATPGGRDSRGRFTPRSEGAPGPGGAPGPDGGPGPGGPESEGSRTSRALGSIGSKIVSAVQEVGQGSDEADPSVKAFNEIAQPLSRGFGKIFGGSEDKKQDRWYRKFWREMTQKRRDDEVNNRATRRSLRDLLLAGRGGESGGGIMGILAMLFGPLLAMFAKFFAGFSKIFKLLGAIPGVKALSNLIPGRSRDGGGGPGRGGSGNPGGGPGPGGRGGPGSRNPPDAGGPGGRGGRGPAPPPIPPGGGGAGRGLLRRLPLIGSLLSLGFMASDVMASEGGEGTREEKDRSTGSAVGRGVGSIGGMAAGAAAGAALGSIVPGLGTAIGGIIGGVVGGFMGDKAGDIIGETVGGWVSDLRNSNIGATITEKWNYTSDFMGSLWSQATAGIAERWTAVSDTVSSMWTTVSDTASATWAAVSAGAETLWGGISAAVTGAWTSAVDKMQAGWSSAVDLAAKGWDMLSGLAGSAKDWLKEKTGVDLEKVYENVGAKATEIVGGAQDAASSAWSKVTDVAASAKSAVAAGASKVADATGVTSAIGAFRTAGKVADNKRGLRRAMSESNISDPKEQAMFMAQMDHESGGFKTYEENLSYGAQGLRKTFGKYYKTDAEAQADARNPEAIANKVYGGRMGNTDPGDGYKFRGRGAIQLTGKDNYAAAGKDLGLDLVNNPELAKDPDNAGKIAAWYWKKNKLGEAAKSGDVTAVTKKINGGTNGLADRKEKYGEYLAETKSGDLTGQSIAPDQQMASTTTGPAANAFAGVDTVRKGAPVVVASAPSPANHGLSADNSFVPPESGSGQAITSSPSNPFAALGGGEIPEASSANNPFAALENGADSVPSVPASPGNPFGALDGRAKLESGPRSSGGMVATLFAGAKVAQAPTASAPVSLASGSAPPAMTAVPSAPAVSIPPAPAVAAIAEAPEVEPTPMGSPGRRQSATPAAPANIPRDIEDRRIAHIVTGAYSGAV